MPKRPEQEISQDSQAKALKPASARYERRVAGTPGLCLSVYPTGRKMWRVRYWTGRAHRTVQLGPYPAVSMRDARSKSFEIAARVARGDEPAIESRRTAAPLKLNSGIVSLAELWERYLQERGPHLKGLAREIPRWRRHVDPYLGGLALTELTRGMIRARITEIGDGGARGQARMVQALLRMVLNHGVEIDALEQNPMLGVRMVYPAGAPRSRAFNDDELRRIWRALEGGQGLSREAASVLQLCLIIGARINECAGMRLEELDLSPAAPVWRCPAARQKNGHAHEVPITPLARRVIERSAPLAAGGFVFPSPALGGAAAIRADAVSHAGGKLLKRLGIEDAVMHCARHTVKTRLCSERINASRFVADLVQNHRTGTHGDMGAVYDHSDTMPRKRRALMAWDAWLTEIVAPEG